MTRTLVLVIGLALVGVAVFYFVRRSSRSRPAGPGVGRPKDVAPLRARPAAPAGTTVDSSIGYAPPAGVMPAGAGVMAGAGAVSLPDDAAVSDRVSIPDADDAGWNGTRSGGTAADNDGETDDGDVTDWTGAASYDDDGDGDGDLAGVR